jgi:hypothetical protein
LISSTFVMQQTIASRLLAVNALPPRSETTCSSAS